MGSAGRAPTKNGASKKTAERKKKTAKNGSSKKTAERKKRPADVSGEPHNFSDQHDA